MMGKRLSDKNPFLRDPEKKKRLMVSAITSSQRQEGIDISDARAEEVYKIVFEEPPVAFFRLTQTGDDREQLFVKSLAGGAHSVRFDIPRRDLLAVEGSPLAYWLPVDVLHLFRELPKIYPTFGSTHVGVFTHDDDQYLRERWEIPARNNSVRRWVRFYKGGDFSRFYFDTSLMIDWSTSAQDWYRKEGRTRDPSLYFRGGLTWAPRTQRGFSLRRMQRDCIFGNKGPAILCKHEGDEPYLLGIGNSNAFEFIARTLSSFGSYEATSIAKLPVPHAPPELRRRISTLASQIHDAKATWDEGNETSTGFKESWLGAALREHSERPLTEALEAVLAREAAADAEIQTWYAELDIAVFEAYGLSPETRETVLKDLGPLPPELIWPQMEGKSAEQKRMEHVVRLLSFCVKRVIEGDDDGIVPLVACNNEPPLEERVLAELGKLVGADRAHVFEGEVASELRKKVPGYKRADSIGDFLANTYFEHHARLYKSRPIFWHLASARDGGGTPTFAVLAHYHRFCKDALRKLRGTYIRSFIERRERELAQARKDNRTDDALERQQEIEEGQAFDRKLQGLEEGHFPIRVPWKSAAEQPKGWDPDIDDGVKVNILPLQTAGLLRIIKVVATKGAEEDNE